MPTYPYISGPGAILKVFEQLRKGFPTKVDAGYLQRLKIATGNESYLIGVLRFLGLIDEEGNRQDDNVDFFFGDEEKFKAGLDARLREAYKHLFDELGDDAFSASRESLGHWFRGADKTSELLGSRQAGTFQTLAALAGHTEMPVARLNSAPKSRSGGATKGASKAPKRTVVDAEPPAEAPEAPPVPSRSDVGLTVRIEVNLPAGGDSDTYDAIFASIKRHLMP